MLNGIKLFLIALAVPLIVATALIGPALTIMAINELGGQEVVPLTFWTWCSVLWLSTHARAIFKKEKEEG